MNEEDINKTMKDKVLAAIDTGKVTMKPKWHFIARTTLLILGIILASLALLYITSFIIFILHQTGIWFTPGFGLRGVREFLMGMPWMLFLLAVLFIVVLQFLVKRYSFAYGRPLLYSAIAIIVLVVMGGFVIALTPVHRGLFEQARQHQLPFAGGFYRQYGVPKSEGTVTPGEITALIEQGYRMLTPREEDLVVMITPETRFPLGMNFEVGDKILVIGDRENGSIKAFGIREITDDSIRAPGHRRGVPDFGPPRRPGDQF